MKLLLLALLISTTSVFAQSKTNRFEQLFKQAEVMTDLHFCVLMADGTNVTKSIDGLLWQGLDCNDVIDEAKKLGVTNIEIEEQIVDSLKDSTLNKLEDCAQRNIPNIENSCSDLMTKAKELGLTEKEIKEEIGFLHSFL
jgi:hypothetical protein